MELKTLLLKRVFLPFWPLPVALFFGIVTCPRVHVFWWEIAVKISCLLGVLISLRYLWAMKFGAPMFAWMIWLGLAFGSWVVSMFFVSEIARLVL
jgi:hypothetical protein